MDFLPADFLLITARLLTAAVLCGAIGFEREQKQQPAGFRTHLLVGVASCLMMLLSITGFDAFLTDEYEGLIQLDPARIPSYVISGIGFLGAGTILVHRGSVIGLTTAASIWTAAGIGLVVGIGMYYAAALTTLIALITLYLLGKLERHLFSKSRLKTLTVLAGSEAGTLTVLTEVFSRNGIAIQNFRIEGDENSMMELSLYEFSFKPVPQEKQIAIIEELRKLPSVRNVTL